MVGIPSESTTLLLDVDVAHTRRNLESILSLIRCVGRGFEVVDLVLGDRWQTLKAPTVTSEGNATPSSAPSSRKRCRRSSKGIRTFASSSPRGRPPGLDRRAGARRRRDRAFPAHRATQPSGGSGVVTIGIEVAGHEGERDSAGQSAVLSRSTRRSASSDEGRRRGGSADDARKGTTSRSPG